MNGEFMPMSLGTSSGNTSTYATTKTDQTDMDIWKELGIEVKTQDDDLGLNFEDYLQLMVQQLQNQTMDNTMDSSCLLYTSFGICKGCIGTRIWGANS